MENRKLNEIEKSILLEIGNMCAGNATTALAQIIGRRIELDLPSASLISLNDLPKYMRLDPEESIIGIHMHIWGGVQGNAMMVLPRQESFRLVDLLIGRTQENAANLTEIGISALKEMGNIIVSAYLSALSAFTGIAAFPSTVTLTSGATRSLVSLAFTGIKREEVEESILVEARFRETQRDLEGSFFIVFDAESITAILARAKGMIKNQG